MEIKVYDKAIWHIDDGFAVDQVLSHFSFIMNWSKQHRLLSDEGEEILSFGIDESISLHSRMFTEKGNCFMERFYDKYISNVSNNPEMENDFNTL